MPSSSLPWAKPTRTPENGRMDRGERAREGQSASLISSRIMCHLPGCLLRFFFKKHLNSQDTIIPLSTTETSIIRLLQLVFLETEHIGILCWTQVAQRKIPAPLIQRRGPSRLHAITMGTYRPSGSGPLYSTSAAQLFRRRLSACPILPSNFFFSLIIYMVLSLWLWMILEYMWRHLNFLLN
jgi:hypothetical protein